ncbi:MAG: Hsp20/alpha crystallin family protein [Planctomycetota bacterium]
MNTGNTNDVTLCTTNDADTQVRAGGPTAETRAHFRPRADIVETEAAYHVTLDVPGVGEGDVDVTLDGDVLTVEADAREPQFEGRVLARRGYRVGPYRRSFRLGEGLSRDGIDASLAHGVLTVTVPKMPEKRPQKIAVRTS